MIPILRPDCFHDPGRRPIRVRRPHFFVKAGYGPRIGSRQTSAPRQSRITRKMPRTRPVLLNVTPLFFGSGGSDHASRPFRSHDRLSASSVDVNHSSRGVARARRRRRRLRTPVSTESYRRARADTPSPCRTAGPEPSPRSAVKRARARCRWRVICCQQVLEGRIPANVRRLSAGRFQVRRGITTPWHAFRSESSTTTKDL